MTLKQLLESVLNGKENIVQLPFTTIKEITDTLIELGCNDNLVESFDTNDWSIDFTLVAVKDNVYYTLRGSLFYGNFRFYKEEYAIEMAKQNVYL